MGKRDTERDWGVIEIPRRFELPARPREPFMWALAELANDLAGQVRGDKDQARFPPGLGDALRAHKVVEAIKSSSDDMMWVSVN
jgi:hypothetical protein